MTWRPWQLVPAGALLLTVSKTGTAFQSIPAWLFDDLARAGIFVIGAAIAGEVVRIIGIRVKKLVESRVHVAFPTHALVALPEDLPKLRDLYAHFFPSAAPTLEQMRQWYARNPNIFYKVVAISPETGAEKIIGSFKAIPLRRSAISLLNEELLNGSTIRADHIARSIGKASALYIGDVVSISKADGPAVMVALMHFLAENLREGMLVFVRPLTSIGLHYVVKYRFQPVGVQTGMGRIYRLSAKDAIELTRKYRTRTPGRRTNRTDHARRRLGDPLFFCSERIVVSIPPAS